MTGRTLVSEVLGSLAALQKPSLRDSPLLCDFTVRSLLRRVQNHANLTVDVDDQLIRLPTQQPLMTGRPLAAPRTVPATSPSLCT